MWINLFLYELKTGSKFAILFLAKSLIDRILNIFPDHLWLLMRQISSNDFLTTFSGWNFIGELKTQNRTIYIQTRSLVTILMVNLSVWPSQCRKTIIFENVLSGDLYVSCYLLVNCLWAQLDDIPDITIITSYYL